jgi:hypothetical protein
MQRDYLAVRVEDWRARTAALGVALVADVEGRYAPLPRRPIDLNDGARPSLRGVSSTMYGIRVMAALLVIWCNRRVAA